MHPSRTTAVLAFLHCAVCGLGAACGPADTPAVLEAVGSPEPAGHAPHAQRPGEPEAVFQLRRALEDLAADPSCWGEGLDGRIPAALAVVDCAAILATDSSGSPTSLAEFPARVEMHAFFDADQRHQEKLLADAGTPVDPFAPIPEGTPHMDVPAGLFERVAAFGRDVLSREG